MNSISIPQQMDKELKPKELAAKHARLLSQFCDAYRKVEGTKEEVITRFLQLVDRELTHPFTFEPFHQKVRSPIDYYQFSIDFVGPLVDLPHSTVLGLDILNQMDAQLKRGENVILLANHQTEADPQVISILLNQTHPQVGDKVIYVAGERVVTDPLAIPFSMGCNLLCIYSKRYIDNPPELKTEKQLHNKSTMELMSRLLREGGKIIYVAPSGGRDRRGASGEIEVAPFDPQSLEMFYLMARKAKTPTHFYPLALVTYDILPPPETVQVELGEVRITKKAAAHLAFLPEFDMEKFPGSEENEKTARRQHRADVIWNIVNEYHSRMR